MLELMCWFHSLSGYHFPGTCTCAREESMQGEREGGDREGRGDGGRERGREGKWGEGGEEIIKAHPTG